MGKIMVTQKTQDFSTGEIARFILRQLKPFPVPILTMFMVAVLWAIDLSLRPYVLKIIIDRVSSVPHNIILDAVALPALVYFLMMIIYPSFFRFYGYFVEIKMIPNLRRNIANASFGALIKKNYAFYQNNFSGSLTNKVNDLTASVPEIVQIVLDRYFSHALALAIAIFTLWQVSVLIAGVMLVWSILFVGGSFLFAEKLSTLSDKWSECGSTITGKMVDALSNILSIRLFARAKAERATLSSAFDAAVLAEQKMQWAHFWMWVFYGYSFTLVQGISLYLLLQGRQAGWISVGDFIVVLSINFAIVDVLSHLTREFSQFSKLWGKITQALRTIQVASEIQDKPNAASLVIKKGEVVFDNVKFHYQGSDPLFQNKSITIASGQKVGLVGYSGGGKSTFVNLILRLYDPVEGRILIDGQDIRGVTQDSLHSAIGMIPQDPSLFHRTLMENIRFGRLEASDEEVITAAKRAHAHDFIISLAQGYDSLVGERGVKLSGGQRQRIAIARTILKNAPILILDEATSQLDSVTEQGIQESLWHLMQDKTTIVIAHRLSTLLHMDRILVFDQGKIIEDGTHAELLGRNGLYKTLWDAQVGGFLLDKKNGDES